MDAAGADSWGFLGAALAERGEAGVALPAADRLAGGLFNDVEAGLALAAARN